MGDIDLEATTWDLDKICNSRIANFIGYCLIIPSIIILLASMVIPPLVFIVLICHSIIKFIWSLI